MARVAGTTQAASATASIRSADGRKGERIGRAHAEQEARHQACQDKCGQQADDDAARDDLHALTHDQPEHIGRTATQRQANADVLRVLLDVVRHHAVDADDGQDERDQGEASDQQRQRLRPFERLRNQLVDRRDV